MTSGSTASSSRWADSPSSDQMGWNPCAAGSRQSTRQWRVHPQRSRPGHFLHGDALPLLQHSRFNIVHRGVAHVPLDQINDEFWPHFSSGHRCAQWPWPKRAGPGWPRWCGVFHHVGDQLAHKPVELLVDEVVFFQDVQRRLGIEASKASSALRNRPEARSAAMRRSLEGNERAAPLSMMDLTMRAILCARRPCAPGWPWPWRRQSATADRARGLTSGNDGGELVVDLHFHRVHTLLYGGHLFPRLPY